MPADTHAGRMNQKWGDHPLYGMSSGGRQYLNEQKSQSEAAAKPYGGYFDSGAPMGPRIPTGTEGMAPPPPSQPTTSPQPDWTAGQGSQGVQGNSGPGSGNTLNSPGGPWGQSVAQSKPESRSTPHESRANQGSGGGVNTGGQGGPVFSQHKQQAKPPAHAPAHGVRGTQPTKYGGTKPRPKPKQIGYGTPHQQQPRPKPRETYGQPMVTGGMDQAALRDYLSQLGVDPRRMQMLMGGSPSPYGGTPWQPGGTSMPYLGRPREEVPLARPVVQPGYPGLRQY